MHCDICISFSADFSLQPNWFQRRRIAFFPTAQPLVPVVALEHKHSRPMEALRLIKGYVRKCATWLREQVRRISELLCCLALLTHDLTNRFEKGYPVELLQEQTSVIEHFKKFSQHGRACTFRVPWRLWQTKSTCVVWLFQVSQAGPVVAVPREEEVKKLQKVRLRDILSTLRRYWKTFLMCWSRGSNWRDVSLGARNMNTKPKWHSGSGMWRPRRCSWLRKSSDGRWTACLWRGSSWRACCESRHASVLRNAAVLSAVGCRLTLLVALQVAPPE